MSVNMLARWLFKMMWMDFLEILVKGYSSYKVQSTIFWVFHGFLLAAHRALASDSSIPSVDQEKMKDHQALVSVLLSSFSALVSWLGNRKGVHPAGINLLIKVLFGRHGWTRHSNFRKEGWPTKIETNSSHRNSSSTVLRFTPRQTPAPLDCFLLYSVTTAQNNNTQRCNWAKLTFSRCDEHNLFTKFATKRYVTNHVTVANYSAVVLRQKKSTSENWTFLKWQSWWRF